MSASKSSEGITAQKALAAAAQELTKAGIEEPLREARYLLALALNQEAGWLTPANSILACAQRSKFEALVARRKHQEPFAYIAGRKEFWSLEFLVSPAVLIPRPDTETVVELALGLFADRSPPRRILDLGTGSGCLLLALLAEWPQATGMGIDMSEGALAVATANAKQLGLSERAAFQKGDWCEGQDGFFGLVVSNPPYVSQAEWSQMAQESRAYEPALALLGGGDGLACYRRIASDASRVLGPEGVLVVESGATQAQAISGIFKDKGWQTAGTRRDLAGHERALAFRVPATPVQGKIAT